MTDQDRMEKLRIIEDMQAVAAQMRKDDLDENPQLINEFFTCSACGKSKDYAGSMKYSEYRLCNDCVVLAETGFALGKLRNISELIDSMEDKRLKAMCDFIKVDEKSHKN